MYRFEPNTGIVEAVADDFVAPNGIEFSPDFKHVYITDTGRYADKEDLTNPASIYRYEVTANGKGIENRRLFAYSPNGIPDGIHTDTNGNVYCGCGDGVHVWSLEGVPLGKFVVPGTPGIPNFAFFPGGMYIFSESKLWKIRFDAEGREIRRDFGLK